MKEVRWIYGEGLGEDVVRGDGDSLVLSGLYRGGEDDSLMVGLRRAGRVYGLDFPSFVKSRVNLSTACHSGGIFLSRSKMSLSRSCSPPFPQALEDSCCAKVQRSGNSC